MSPQPGILTSTGTYGQRDTRANCPAITNDLESEQKGWR